MASEAMVMIVIAALATGAVAGGGTILTDMAEFEMDIKVVDAQTGKPVVGALVEIRDGNGTLIASGLTDKDGEFELDIDDSRVHDDDSDYTHDDRNETDHCDDLSVVGDDSDCDDDVNDRHGTSQGAMQLKTNDDDDSDDDSDDCVDDHTNVSQDDCDDDSDDCVGNHTNASQVKYVLKTIVGPLSIVVSKTGYVTQTISIELNSMDDCDMKVKLEQMV